MKKNFKPRTHYSIGVRVCVLQDSCFAKKKRRTTIVKGNDTKVKLWTQLFYRCRLVECNATLRMWFSENSSWAKEHTSSWCRRWMNRHVVVLGVQSVFHDEAFVQSCRKLMTYDHSEFSDQQVFHDRQLQIENVKGIAQRTYRISRRWREGLCISGIQSKQQQQFILFPRRRYFQRCIYFGAGELRAGATYSPEVSTPLLRKGS